MRRTNNGAMRASSAAAAPELFPRMRPSISGLFDQARDVAPADLWNCTALTSAGRANHLHVNIVVAAVGIDVRRAVDCEVAAILLNVATATIDARLDEKHVDEPG